jgi:hypothetical protein
LLPLSGKHPTYVQNGELVSCEKGMKEEDAVREKTISDDAEEEEKEDD